MLSRRGGSARDRHGPPTCRTLTSGQVSTYLEREVASNFGVRTGFVWNGRRQPYGSVNINRPLSAYNVPIRFADPGPDGLVGSGDDGPAIDGFNLSAAALAAGVVNFTRNLERRTATSTRGR